MKFSIMFYIYTTITIIAWLAVIKYRMADPRKSPMRNFLIMLTLAYSFQAVSNFVFPTPNRDNNPFFIKVHLFTWFVHILAMTLALFHLTRAKKGKSLVGQRFAIVTLVVSLTGLISSYFLHLFWIDYVPFRHLPGNIPELVFVESYYLAGAIFLFLTARNLTDIAFHEKLLAQRSRTIFSGLAAFFGLLYYAIKVCFAASAVIFQLSRTNYPFIFQFIEQLTLYLMIAVAVSWAIVFLPSGMIIRLATPFDFLRKLLTLFRLHDTLRHIHKPENLFSLQTLQDVDLAIIGTVTRILDTRDVLLSNEPTNSKHQVLLSIKDSSDIWDVVESCVAIRHRLRASAN